MTTDIRIRRAAVMCVLLAACRTEHGDAHGSLVADLRIGDGETTAAFEFTEISQIVAGPGSIYVRQRGEPEVRVFDFQGRHVRTIGRRGSGPGEFDVLASIGLLGDTLWTIDTNLRRISLFSAADGKLITTMRYQSEVSLAPTLGNVYYPYPEQLLGDGTMLGFGATPGSVVANGQVTRKPTLRMLRSGATTDTLSWVPLTHGSLIIRSAHVTMYAQQPFTDSYIVEYAIRAGRIYVIDRTAATSASRAEYAVTAIRTSGDTLWSRHYAYTPHRLDERVADSVRARTHRVYSTRGFSASQIDAALFVPDFMTPITATLAGDDGTLWLRREDLPGLAQYDVIDSTGRALGRVTAAHNARLRWASGSVVWGEELDADDVPRLVRYRVVWP